MRRRLIPDLNPAELLDIREAAEFLRVSETSLRRWTNAGSLRCLRIGGRRERRFLRSDLLAFLGGAQVPAAPASRNHFCGLYTSDISRARVASAFLAAGLRSGGAAVLVAAKDVQRAVLDALERDQPSIRKTPRLVLGEYRESVPAQLAYLRGRVRSVLRNHSRVHLVGDVSGSPLAGLKFADILEYEAEYEQTIARGFPVLTLCQYDARAVSGVDVAKLVQCHPGGLQ